LALIIKQSYQIDPQRVWKAITDVNEMKVWYFDIIEFKPEEGFKFFFYGKGAKGEEYLHQCTVMESIENKLLSYSWCYDTIEGNTTVRFELQQTGDRTLITLTHKGLESFPKNNPDLSVDSFTQGWTYILGTALKDHLENK